MATITPQVITRLGIAETSVAASAGGDALQCGPNFFFKVVNGGASPITVTLAIPSVVSGYSGVVYTNTQVVVPNTENRLIGPLNGQIYADPITGLCTVTYSAVTTVTVRLFSLAEGF